jgi:hypothetical protein
MNAVLLITKLHEMEAEYRRSHGRFTSMRELENTAGFEEVSTLLANVGPFYEIRFHVESDKYVMEAIQKKPRDPGARRSFYSDESRVIRENWDQTATKDSPPLK